MKKFSYELEDVLIYRRYEQQQAEIELGKALAAEKEIQDKLDALALQKATVQKQMKGSTDPMAVINAGNFYSFVKKQSEFLFEKIAEAKLVSDQKREVLKACMQKTDALEELKKVKFEEYKRMVQDEEDKEIDDIVTSRTGTRLNQEE